MEGRGARAFGRAFGAFVLSVTLVGCGSSGTKQGQSAKGATTTQPAPAKNSAFEPFLGEIRMFAFGNSPDNQYAPVGWHFADGSALDIAENQALYYVIGTTFGGDGKSTFALPKIPPLAQPNLKVGSVRYCIAVEGAFPKRDGVPGQNPFLGQIEMFAGNYAPGGRHLADGSLLPIDSNAALFSVIDSIYGGDGKKTFALPAISSPSKISFLVATTGNYPTRDENPAREAFIGQMGLFAGGFEPGDWPLADGAPMLMNNENNALFSLLRTQYGGNGRSTFDIPNVVEPPFGNGNVKFLLATKGVYPPRT